jgi:hypothetical protein
MNFDKFIIVVEIGTAPKVCEIITQNLNCICLEIYLMNEMFAVHCKQGSTSEVDFLALPHVLEASQVPSTLDVNSTPRAFEVVTLQGEDRIVLKGLLDADKNIYIGYVTEIGKENLTVITYVLKKEDITKLKGIAFVKEVNIFAK